ncbi:MAG: hypothetical protein GX318_00230 [Clostridia bacterium]|nr:hypothetical protein [Clostridia bacterium]
MRALQVPTLPNGIIGNSNILATLSKEGRLERLFWPNIDFPQNIGQSLAGIIEHRPCHGERLFWLHDKTREHEQYYIDNSNVLVTDYLNNEKGIKVMQRDFVHPHQDILVRHFNIENIGQYDSRFTFVYYNHMTLGDMDKYNSAYYSEESGAFVHYFRNIYFLLTSNTLPDAYQCGTPLRCDDPMKFIQKGIPAGEKTAHGSSASAGIWDLGLMGKGENKEVTIYIAASENLDGINENLSIIKETPISKMLTDTVLFWEDSLLRSKKIQKADPVIKNTYKRSLLVLELLQDRKSGAIIAAPEFDPNYIYSGGYGYSWPRDSVFIAWALAAAGRGNLAENYYHFAFKTQRPDGLWSQRYYSTGQLAPGWGDQLDETGIMLWGIWKHYDLTKNKDFLLQAWPSVDKAAKGLILTLDINRGHLPLPSMDLWEDSYCTGTYTAAAISAGLKAAGEIAEELNKKSQESKEWGDISKKIVNSIHDLLWREDKGYFARSLVKDIQDPTFDSAVMGLVYPFKIIDPKCGKTVQLIHEIEKNLYCDEVGGILRYRGDDYIGGNPWVLITLWLSLCFNTIGEREKAKKHFNWALKQQNSLGLFPEQVGKYSNKPIWALPLGWSHAMFILSILSLEGGADF